MTKTQQETAETLAKELKPCPFCGGSASWLDDRECQEFNEVSCNSNINRCVMPNFPMSANAWNTRTALEQPREWQKIETAPKDGSNFLGYNENQNWVGVCWYQRVHSIFCYTGGRGASQITHWMPLPQPPKLEGEQG